MSTFYAAHNEYLEQLLTTGLLGLAAWLAFVGAHLRRGFARWSAPGAAPVLLALCSYLAQAAVSIRVSMVFPAVMLLFALLAAFTAEEAAPAPAQAAPKAAGRAGKRRKKQAAPAPQPPGAAYNARVGAAAVLAMWVSAVLSTGVFWFLF